jgi:hypothetical protein
VVPKNCPIFSEAYIIEAAAPLPSQKYEDDEEKRECELKRKKEEIGGKKKVEREK